MNTSVDNDCQFKLDAFRCTQPVKTGKSVSDVVDVNSLLWEIPRLAEISSLFGSMQLHSQFRGGGGTGQSLKGPQRPQTSVKHFASTYSLSKFVQSVSQSLNLFLGKKKHLAPWRA